MPPAEEMYTATLKLGVGWHWRNNMLRFYMDEVAQLGIWYFSVEAL
jgi:hypothetical protein